MLSRQQDPKCRLKSSHVRSSQYTLIIPHRLIMTNYYVILGPRDKATNEKKKPPKRVKNLVTPSTIFTFISSSSTGELCSQPITSTVRRTGRMFPEHVERSFLDPKYSFIGVRRILPTIFAQLRTNYIRRILPTIFAEQMLAQL